MQVKHWQPEPRVCMPWPQPCRGCHCPSMCRAGTNNWGKYALAGMTIAYALVFLVYIGLGYIQLHARPFRDLRTAIILFRLQVGACCVAGHAQGLLAWAHASSMSVCGLPALRCQAELSLPHTCHIHV